MTGFGNLRARTTMSTFSLAASLIISACATGIDPAASNGTLSDLASMTATAVSPTNEQTDVPLDARIKIQFSTRIDALSPDPANFAIFGEGGNIIPFSGLVSNQDITGPNGEVQSLITLFPNGGWLPHRKYFVMWRAANTTLPTSSPQPSPSVNPNLTGIRGMQGEYLAPGSVSFTTGESSILHSTNRVEVRAVEPGVIFKTGSTDSNSSLSDIFKDGYTSNPTAPVMIRFSEPIRHFREIQSTHELSQEIGINAQGQLVGSTPADLPGIGILKYEGSTAMQSILTKLKDIRFDSANFALDWARVMGEDMRSRQIPGRILTTNGRQVLQFIPDSAYPSAKENPTASNSVNSSLIVVIISGIKSKDGKRELQGGFAIAGFMRVDNIPMPGFKLPTLLGGTP